MPRSIL